MNTNTDKEATMATAPVTPALRVRELRRVRGLSQGELARRSGIDVRTLRRIENDTEYQPSFAQVARIAAELGVELGDLAAPVAASGSR